MIRDLYRNRIYALLLSLCILFSLTGCGQPSPASQPENAASSSDAESSRFASLQSSDNSEVSESEVRTDDSAADPDASSPGIAVEAVEVDGIVHQEMPAPDRGSLLTFTTARDFASGTPYHLEIGLVGDGSMTIARDGDLYHTEGTFLSDKLDTVPFTRLTVSWSCDYPFLTGSEMEVRVRLTDGGEPVWSDWFSWGEFSLYAPSVSLPQEDRYGMMELDTLRLNSAANGVQLRATLRTMDIACTPVLRAVRLSLQNENGTLSPVQAESPVKDAWLTELAVPAISAMEQNPSLADAIFSPTSIAMLLDYAGCTVMPEEIAMNSLVDDDFGSLCCNAALASTYGYDCYAAYADPDTLRSEIAAGHPVALHVAYTNNEADTILPYLEDAPTRSKGHLLVLCGFQRQGDQEYAIVNDPAAPESSQVRRLYPTQQLMQLWDGMAVFLHEKETDNGSPLEIRELTLREHKNGYVLYDGQELFGTGARAVTVVTGGQKNQYPSPMHGGVLKLDGDVSKLTVWVVTDMGILYCGRLAR